MHLIDVLFVDSSRKKGRIGRWDAALLTAALLGTAIFLQLGRLGWDVSLNTLWAEDGLIFTHAALTHGFLEAIITPYANYLVVVPHLIAEAASLMPLVDTPAAISILSAGAVALSGLVVWLASAAHIRNPYLRGALVTVTVIAPVAGIESIDSGTYVPWYMLFACFWALLWRPASWRGTVAASTFVLLTGLSTPGVWFFAPLALMRAIAVRDRGDLAIVFSYWLGAVAQVPVLIFNTEPAVASGWSHDIWIGYLQRVVAEAPLGLSLAGSAWIHFGWLLLIALSFAGIFALAEGFRCSGSGARWIAGIAVVTSLGMFVVSVYQRAAGERITWSSGTYWSFESRYTIVPTLLLVSAVIVLLDDVVRRRPENRVLAWAPTATVVVLAIAVATSYWTRNREIRSSPWRASLEAAAIECEVSGVGEVVIPTSPPGWGVQLPCEQVVSASPPHRG